MKQYIKRIINISLLLAVVFCGSMNVKAYDAPEDVPYAKCEYEVESDSSTTGPYGKVVLIYNDGKIEMDTDCDGYACSTRYVTFELSINLSTTNFLDDEYNLFCPPLYYKTESEYYGKITNVIVSNSSSSGGMTSLTGKIEKNDVVKAPNNFICLLNTNIKNLYISIGIDKNGNYECIDDDNNDSNGCKQGDYKVDISNLNKGDLYISNGSCQSKDNVNALCSPSYTNYGCRVSSDSLGGQAVKGEINEDSQKNADTLADDLADFEFNFEYKEGCASLGSLQEEIMKIYHIVEAVLGVGLVGLTIMDYTKAVTTSDDVAKATKKATKNFTTRIVIFIVLILLPSLIRFFLGAIGLGDYVCF